MNDKVKKDFLNMINKPTNLKSKPKKINRLKTIEFKDKNTYYSLDMHKILYVKVMPNKRMTLIKYENKNYIVSKSLLDIVNLLDTRFIQTQRACYINKDRLEYIDLTNNIIKFDNDITICYLSRKFKKDIYKK